MQDLNAPPLNPLPPVVWLLALPIIAMEVVLSAAGAGLVGGPEGVGWRQQAVQRFGLPPEYLRAMWEAGQWPLDGVMRLATYPFVHTGFLHAVFVLVFLLALGKFVGEIYRPWAVVATFLGAAAAGAVLFAALGFEPWLIGGYPAVYGLIGALTYVRWMRLGRSGGNRLQAFQLIGMLMGVQLLFGAIMGANPVWVAELAGFAAGFALSFVVSPGAMGRIAAWLRAR